MQLTGARPETMRASEAAKIVISYSRQDAQFVRRLCDSLVERGYLCYFDMPDIGVGEEWTIRLGEMIAQADTLIFVISLSSVASAICRWEMEEAQKQNKRVIPVVLDRVADGAVPAELSRLNYLFFDDPGSYPEMIESLVGAIESDIGWIRQHTHLSLQSTLWRANDRSSDYLLRGAVLREAEGWLQVSPSVRSRTDRGYRGFLGREPTSSSLVG